MINVEKITNEIIDFIKDYYNKNNLNGVVIGISGGKDSALVATLFCKAIGSNNVLGIWMPCHSNEKDKNDAYLLAKTFNFELIEYDLTKIYDDYVNNIIKNNSVSDNNLIDSNINIKSRLRMLTLYYYASMYSKLKQKNYIVSGTSNKCEQYVGYFTKGGDNVCDISILSDLTVSEIIELSKYLKIPDTIYLKKPSDGLCGVSDEEKMGVSYNDIETYIYEKDNNLKSSLDKDIYDKITKLHENNLHKFNVPTYRRNI